MRTDRPADRSGMPPGQRHAPEVEEFPRSFAMPTHPPLPANVPPWLESLATKARSGGIHRKLSDMSRKPPPTVVNGKPVRPSAVLMLLGGDPAFYPTASQMYPDDARILLTHRAPSLRSHSGQMAFPGGRKDPADADPIATALREAREETDVRQETVDPLAILNPIYIDRTHNVVSPVLAYWRKPTPVYPASPQEVARVAEVPIAELVDPSKRIQVGVRGWQGPAFRIGDLVLWGFTGGLVDAVLREAGWEQPWDRSTVYDLAEILAHSANNEPTAMWRHQQRLRETE